MKNKIVIILMSVLAVLASLSILVFAVKYNPNAAESINKYLSFSLNMVYVLFFLALVLLVGFAIWTLISNFKQSRSALIGVGIVVLIFVIAYTVSPSTSSLVEQSVATTPGASKLIGSGLIATYIFLFGAILATIWSTLSTRFK